MTLRLLLWKWSDVCDTPAKRRKQAIKYGDITLELVATGDHFAIGTADSAAFRRAVDEEYGSDEGDRGFTIEELGKCVLVRYPDALRFSLVPKLAYLSQPFGLNAAEV